ncbi:MAG: heme NO-binding domain-containing protein [Myxococcota bacterium]
MYGLVNQAIRDLILERGGAELWRRVRAASNLPFDEFVRMQAYDDAVTFAMVRGAAAELGATEPDLLRAFGRFWIAWVERDGFGALLDSGRTLGEQLRGLDTLHARLSASYPEFRAPVFTCDDTAEGWRVTYRSSRVGLGSMVAGMLEGLALRHGQPVTVTPAGEGTFHVVRT